MAPASGATGAETPTLVESIAVEGGVELLENGEGGWYDEDGTRWFYYDVQLELHRYTVTFTASGTEGFGIISVELVRSIFCRGVANSDSPGFGSWGCCKAPLPRWICPAFPP